MTVGNDMQQVMPGRQVARVGFTGVSVLAATDQVEGWQTYEFWQAEALGESFCGLVKLRSTGHVSSKFPEQLTGVYILYSQ